MSLLDGTNAPTISVDFDLGNQGIFTLGISLLGGSDVLGSTVSANWSTIPTTDIRAITIRRGRTREDQANQPGALSLTLENYTSQYDPDNSSNIYAWAGYSVLSKGMGVRVRATWSGTDYVIYRGYLEQLDTDMSLDPVVVMQFTDALAKIGSYTVAAISSAYSGDTTATRVGRILDAAGWSSSLRSLTGSRQMKPTTYGATALALSEEANNCEYGRFYADRQGNVTLIPYESLLTTPYRFTLSDSRATGTIEYDSIGTNPGAKYLTNTVVLTQDNSNSQTATNTNSVSRYGTAQKLVTAPLLNNSDAITMAQIYADKNALPATRVDHVEFDALGINTLWVSLLQTDLGDNVNVERTTIDARNRTFTSIVEAINIDITSFSWRVGLDLSPSKRTGIFILGTSTLGGSDTLWY
jgi:hypothetical protein